MMSPVSIPSRQERSVYNADGATRRQNRKGTAMHASATVVVLSLAFAAAAQPVSPDAEGFIRNWLVLAPIAIEGESGASEIDRDFLNEATIAPKAGDKIAA